LFVRWLLVFFSYTHIQQFICSFFIVDVEVFFLRVYEH
jgi:hypothetical protein